MKRTKILASLLLLTMMFNIVLPIISEAAEQTNAIMEIVNHENANKEILVAEGETFSIDVNLRKGTDKGKAITGALEFDSSKLEIVNKELIDEKTYAIIIPEDVVPIGNAQNLVSWDAGTNQIYFLFQSNSGQLRDGTTFRVEFKVKEGASGKFNFNLINLEYFENGAAAEPIMFPITAGAQKVGQVATPLKSIKLNKTEVALGINGTENLKVTYTPSETTSSKEVKWESSNSNIVTVDGNGKITGKNPGTATITATSVVEGVAPATCNVTVTSKLQSISLNQTSLEMGKGQTKKLNVTYNPSNTTDSKEVVWTSNNTAVATVDNQGNVKAISNGTATITAASVVEGVAPATCKVTVTSKLQEITLNKTNLNMNKGTTQKVTVGYVPVDTTDSKEVVWTSSNTAVATVDNQGNIKAVAPGEAEIIANCNGKIAKAKITVKSPLTGIEITNAVEELLPEQEVNLGIKYTPVDTTDSKTIIWESSNTGIVTVNESGKITAIKPGTVTITAKCGNITKTINVKVAEIHTERIAFENPKVEINKSSTIESKIKFYPANTTDDKKVTYSSNNAEIATVDENGKITAIKAGTAIITATSGEKTATCEVTVKVPLTGIKLNQNKVELEKNKTTKLEVTYNEEDTTDDKSIIWTSLNEDVAKVDENGKITAISAGTAVITAQVGKHTASCEISVKVPLTGITIKSNTKLLKKQSETLKVTYMPEDTTDNKKVTWSSKDTSIATIDENGKVTGIKAGTTKIVAKVGNFEKECTVTVEEKKLEGIAISNKLETILKGKTEKLEIIYTPEDTTDDKEVIWKSSDEAILTVDENGNLTGIKAGTATITAISGDFEDSIEIEVEEIKLTGIEIKSENATMKPGDKIKLNVVYTPGNTTDNRNLVFVSSDESVLTIDENGVVTAIKAGKAVVTAIAENGVKTQIEMTVEAAAIEEKPETKVDSPKTGDINIALYAILMVVSFVGIIKTRKK